jgi:adenosylhomocysteine nucleosidase
MLGLCIKSGMTSEDATARMVARWDTVFLTGLMTVADFEAKVPPTVTGILSFGLCGGLAPGLSVGSVCLASVLIDGNTLYRPNALWTTRLAGVLGVKTVPYFSTGQFNLADTPQQRADLWEKYGCAAIDDESAAMAQFAKERNIPFAILRVVSDAWNDTVPLAARQAVNADGSSNVDSIITWLKDHPDQAGSELIDLAKTAAEYNTALNALLEAGNKVGEYFQWGI